MNRKPITEQDREGIRIKQDLEKLRVFKHRHAHDPRVKESVNKLMYALIVQYNKTKYFYSGE